MATRFGADHDTILAYSKGKWTFNIEEGGAPVRKGRGQAGYKLDKKTLAPQGADDAPPD